MKRLQEDGIVNLRQLCDALADMDSKTTRAPTVAELEELDPKEITRLLQLCELL